MITLVAENREQKWFCRRCDERHVGPCKALQAFYEAKDRRSKETINIKIASDSTLRCAEQVGLRTDIMCMPGGGLGQIANAIKDDPDTKNREEIIVLAGINDVRNRAYQDLNSFAYVVDTSIQKVKEAVPEDSKLTFLHLASNPNDDAVDPDRRFKETYLGQELDKAQDENTTVITIFKHLIDMDGTDHPTREGTASILQTLEEYHPGLILDDTFSTTDRLYLGVQPLFQYGCTTCHEAGNFMNDYGCCDQCLRKLIEHDASDKLKFIEDISADPLPGEDFLSEERPRRDERLSGRSSENSESEDSETSETQSPDNKRTKLNDGNNRSAIKHQHLDGGKN